MSSNVGILVRKMATAAPTEIGGQSSTWTYSAAPVATPPVLVRKYRAEYAFARDAAIVAALGYRVVSKYWATMTGGQALFVLVVGGAGFYFLVFTQLWWVIFIAAVLCYAVAAASKAIVVTYQR